MRLRIPPIDQTPEGAPGGRRLDAALNLLDRQLVDRNGRMAGKVDDLELTPQDDGSLAVTAVLSGAGALGHRMPGLTGRIMEAVWRRLAEDRDPVPARIPYAQISEIGPAVRLGVSRQDLPNQGLERWARSRIVSKLPGERHDPE